jgi:hypothetical protein
MKRLVHTRDISMRTFALGSHAIRVEGRLVDHRYHQKPVKDSETAPVHDMVVQLKVKGPRMVIEQAKAIMLHHPRKDCREALPWVRKLEGVEIAPGYTMKVKRAIGGVRGCAHVTSLVVAMGEAAVHGYLAAYRSKKGRLSEERIRKFINTCHLWREDGPIVKEIRKALKTRNS